MSMGCPDANSIKLRHYFIFFINLSANGCVLAKKVALQRLIFVFIGLKCINHIKVILKNLTTVAMLLFSAKRSQCFDYRTIAKNLKKN